MNSQPNLIEQALFKNKIEYTYNNTNSSFIYKFDIDAEYIPLLLFQPCMIASGNRIVVPNVTYIKEALQTYIIEDYGYRELFENIRDYLIEEPNYYCFNKTHIPILRSFDYTNYMLHESSYNDLNYYYANNFLVISLYDKKDLEVVYSLMFKREHLEYLKLCIFLKETPDSSIFRLDIHEDILNKNFKWPSIKTQVNKKIKLAINSGIEVNYRRSFSDMFLTPKVPQFSKVEEVDKYQDLLNNLFYNNVDKVKELDTFNYHQANNQVIKHRELFPKMYNKPKYKLELTYD